MSTNERSLRRAIGFLTAMRLVINTAHRFVSPFLPAIARGLGISLSQAGTLVSVRWLIGMTVPFVVGSVGRGERRLRLAMAGLGLFAIGAAVTAGSSVYVGALVGFLLMGIAKPSFDIAAQAYVADRTPYHRRARNLSWLELTWAGGLLVGAPLAGWLIDLGGWTLPFWIFGALSAFGVLLARVVLERDGPVVGSVVSRIRLDSAAVAFLAVAALFSLAAELMSVVLGAWLEDSFGLSIISLGLVSTVIGLVELTGEGAVLLYADRMGKRRAVAVGLGISIVGFGALAVVGDQFIAGVAAMAIAFGGFELSIVSAIPLGTELRPNARAQFLSYMMVGFAIGRAVGAVGGTRLFASSGLAANAWAAVVIDVVALVLLLRWVADPQAPTS